MDLKGNWLAKEQEFWQSNGDHRGWELHFVVRGSEHTFDGGGVMVWGVCVCARAGISWSGAQPALGTLLAAACLSLPDLHL